MFKNLSLSHAWTQSAELWHGVGLAGALALGASTVAHLHGGPTLLYALLWRFII